MAFIFIHILIIFSIIIPCRIIGQEGGFEEKPIFTQIREVDIPESKSQSTQKARIWIPKGGSKSPMPLIVVLHTWSGNYRQNKFGGGPVPGMVSVLNECSKKGWAMVMPDFRGPNKRPEACASDLAIRDVLDAVHYMKSCWNIDSKKIYLYGVSGGGHMALMMVARHPELWNGVSSWVPITDLAAWHEQCRISGRKYYKDLELVCGGKPGANKKVDNNYYKRSPLNFLSRTALSEVRIQINAGINDGYDGSVPVSHTLLAFNELAEANNQSQNKISQELLAHIVGNRHVPRNFVHNGKGFMGRKKKVLFYRKAGNATVTIFDGGHEGDVSGAFHFFSGNP